MQTRICHFDWVLVKILFEWIFWKNGRKSLASLYVQTKIKIMRNSSKWIRVQFAMHIASYIDRILILVEICFVGNRMNRARAIQSVYLLTKHDKHLSPAIDWWMDWIAAVFTFHSFNGLVFWMLQIAWHTCYSTRISCNEILLLTSCWSQADTYVKSFIAWMINSIQSNMLLFFLLSPGEKQKKKFDVKLQTRWIKNERLTCRCTAADTSNPIQCMTVRNSM